MLLSFGVIPGWGGVRAHGLEEASVRCLNCIGGSVFMSYVRACACACVCVCVCVCACVCACPYQIREHAAGHHRKRLVVLQGEIHYRFRRLVVLVGSVVLVRIHRNLTISRQDTHTHIHTHTNKYTHTTHLIWVQAHHHATVPQ
jgi:hypothetical protein